MSLVKKMIALSILPAALNAFSDLAVVVNYIKPANTSSANLTVDPLLMTMALQNELFKSGEFRIVDRSTVFNTQSLQDFSMNAGYSAYDAMLLGLEIKTPWIVMGRIRYMDNQVWIQIGLFDSEMEAKIVEVTGYYPNSQQAILEQALPELVKRLVKFDQNPKTEEKPVLKGASIVVRPESVREKNNNNNGQSTVPAIQSGHGFYKWAILGLVTVSAALLLDKVAGAEGTQTAPNPNSEVFVQW